jgi:hypothetical protein
MIPSDNSLTLSADVLAAELKAIQSESIGWLPLGQGVYLHHSDAQASASDEDMVIQVVGIPDITLAGMNVLLLTCPSTLLAKPFHRGKSLRVNCRFDLRSSRPADHQHVLRDHHQNVCFGYKATHLPHIHVEYSGIEAVFQIPDGELLEGTLPAKQNKLVQAWLVLHADELMANWTLAASGTTRYKIEPLR